MASNKNIHWVFVFWIRDVLGFECVDKFAKSWGKCLGYFGIVVIGWFKREFRGMIEEVVREKVIAILLYREAKKKADSNIEEVLEDAVEKEINRFVINNGGTEAQAQKAMEAMGYSNWRSFRDYFKRLILTDYYLSEELKDDRSITYRDLKEFYNDLVRRGDLNWPGMIQFRLIDIKFNNDAGKGEALNKANDILEKIEGGEDFGELAKEYSEDAAHRVELGGLWPAVTLEEGGTLTKPHDVLETAAAEMEVGDVSGAIEGEGHVFILKLEKRRKAGSNTFEEVQDILEKDLRQYQRRKKEAELKSKLFGQANLGDMERFVDHCVEVAYYRLSGGKRF